MRSITMLTLTSILFDSRIQKEAISLANNNYKVRIISVEDKKSDDSLDDFYSVWTQFKTRMNGIEIVPIYLRTRQIQRLPKTIRYTIQFVELFFIMSFRILKKRTDIYHIHDLSPFIFTLLPKIIFRSKIVYDAHEDELSLVPKKLYNLFLIYERYCVKKSSLIITVNDEIASKMYNRYLKEIKVIANRPEYAEMKDIEGINLISEFKLPKNSKILMYVGNLAKEIRGIEMTLKALNSLDENFYFLIMGVGRINEFKEYLELYINENKLSNVKNRYFFIGPFQPNLIVKYLNSADISMLLYQDTMFNNAKSNAPNKFFQSVMARTPILANHNETFPHLIYKNNIGHIGETVKCDDVNQIINIINQMVYVEKQIEYRKNLNQLAEIYSWKFEEEKLINYYNNIDIKS